MIGQTEYRTHNIKDLSRKTPTSNRFEVEGLIVLPQDLGFAGLGLEITDYVGMVIEAETVEIALAAANDIMDGVQNSTDSDDRKEYYLKIEQAD